MNSPVAGNKYLEKIALNKLEQYVVDNLHKFPMQRRKQLAASGMMRSPMQEARGMRKRDKKFIEGAGIKVDLNKNESAEFRHPSTMGEQRRGLGTIAGNVKGLSRGHELDESLEAYGRRQRDTYGSKWQVDPKKVFGEKSKKKAKKKLEVLTGSKNGVVGDTPVLAHFDSHIRVKPKWWMPKSVSDAINSSKSSPAGASHTTLAVLARESNRLRQSRYPEIYDAGNLRGYRKHSGEAALVEEITGKKYGQEHFTNKDLEKLRVPTGKARKNTVIEEKDSEFDSPRFKDQSISIGDAFAIDHAPKKTNKEARLPYPKPITTRGSFHNLSLAEKRVIAKQVRGQMGRQTSEF